MLLDPMKESKDTKVNFVPWLEEAKICKYPRWNPASQMLRLAGLASSSATYVENNSNSIRLFIPFLYYAVLTEQPHFPRVPCSSMQMFFQWRLFKIEYLGFAHCFLFTMWLIQVMAKIGNGLWDNESGILFSCPHQISQRNKGLPCKIISWSLSQTSWDVYA